MNSWAYKLDDGGRYGTDVTMPDRLDIDEGAMSMWIPFADGRRRDGVGDLLEISGISTERHRTNPVSDVLPGDSVNNSVDHGRCHTKFPTEVGKPPPRCGESADFDDLRFGEPCRGVLLADARRAVDLPVVLVVPLRPPAEVAQAVVSEVAVREVAGFHPLWTGTYESFQNQTVDEEPLDLPAGGLGECHRQATVPLDTLDHNSSLDAGTHLGSPPTSLVVVPGEGLHPAQVRDAIDTGVAWHVTPVLFAAVRVVLDLLIQRLAVGIAFRHVHFPLVVP